MADAPITTQIRAALATRLSTILVANGYRSDAGLDVREEPSQFLADSQPRITVYPGAKGRPEDAGSKREREFSVVVEGMVPFTQGAPLTAIEAVEDDIELALSNYLQQPMALPLEWTETLFLERPDGVPAMAVQMMYVTRYRL